MNLRHEALEPLAQQFWTGTRLPNSFPRPIERAVSRSLPLTIVKLPEVTVRHIEQYLMQRGLSGPLPQDNRDMMGCLFAYRGHGIIFVCGADDAAEQRFTIAHDAAHFMMDYLAPREAVVRELGAGMLDVLDGRRPPTMAELGMASLREVRLGSHVHILPRRWSGRSDAPGTGSFDVQVVDPAEDVADALGLELVAPRQAILAMATRYARDYPQIGHRCDLLGAYFGLPPYVFELLLQRLAPQRSPSFLDFAARALGVHTSRISSQSGEGGGHAG